jgi:hypothetical protein
MGLLKIAFVSFVAVKSIHILYMFFEIWVGINEKFFEMIYEWLDKDELV